MIIPVGFIMPYVGDYNEHIKAFMEDEGWLFCNGDYVSKDKYDELYCWIGNVYGEPKNNSFRLPDYRSPFLRGQSSKGDLLEGKLGIILNGNIKESHNSMPLKINDESYHIQWTKEADWCKNVIRIEEEILKSTPNIDEKERLVNMTFTYFIKYKKDNV